MHQHSHIFLVHTRDGENRILKSENEKARKREQKKRDEKTRREFLAQKSEKCEKARWRELKKARI